MLELLAPAGNMSKLKTAFYFGADAAYLGGKDHSLRAFCDNFDGEDLKQAVKYARSLGKKIYVTVNIFAKNADFAALNDYFKFLYMIGADAVIISDPGVFSVCRKSTPLLPVHISTQANTLNKYSAEFWVKEGASRIILARELSLDEIKEIRDYIPKSVEIECFCHGAMCISYSGRCLLSDYFSGRSSNRGECVQACRWNYEIRESRNNGEFYPVEEDGRGSYILNSKDLNMIRHLGEMIKAGVTSFKIEGRMKSEYYVATVVNAYRRALDAYSICGDDYIKDDTFYRELLKTNHRAFTTAYNLDKNELTINYPDAQSSGDRTFVATVLSYDKESGVATVEMRNRFLSGEELELLTPYDDLNAKVVVNSLRDLDGNAVSDARLVQQTLIFDSDVTLHAGDILRR